MATKHVPRYLKTSLSTGLRMRAEKLESNFRGGRQAANAYQASIDLNVCNVGFIPFGCQIPRYEPQKNSSFDWNICKGSAVFLLAPACNPVNVFSRHGVLIRNRKQNSILPSME
jgi:hypothetical protein